LIPQFRDLGAPPRSLWGRAPAGKGRRKKVRKRNLKNSITDPTFSEHKAHWSTNGGKEEQTDLGVFHEREEEEPIQEQEVPTGTQS